MNPLSVEAVPLRVRNLPVTASLGVELRSHQRLAIRKIFAGLRQGHLHQLVVLPTGGGKTVLACHAVKRLRGRALFIVHTDEIVRQTVKTLQRFVPASHVGVVKGKTDEGEKRIVVASVQSLRNPKRLRKLAKDFRVVVWDECHHAQAKSYLAIRKQLSKSKALHLGLTATPWRLDGKPLDELFPHKSVHFTIKDGVEGGWLSDVAGKLVYLKDANFSKLKLDHGDFKPADLEIAMRAANWDEYVARAYFEHAGARKTVAFVPTVAMARQLAERINAEGGRAEAVDGNLSIERRRDILARLAAGELSVVVNCAVLTEGFDDPSIECVIMARPTASWALYVQCVGRGLRLVEGKTCLVLDVVGATRRHSLASFPLFVKRELPGVGGGPGDSKREFGPVSAEMEALWVELLGEEKNENPACVYCRGRTRINARKGNGLKSLLCCDCGRSFTVTSDGDLSKTSEARLRQNVPCIYCKKRTIKKSRQRNGSIQYKCIECKKTFVLMPSGEHPLQRKRRAIPNPPCKFCRGKTHKAATWKMGHQAYRCKVCRKHFIVLI